MRAHIWMYLFSMMCVSACNAAESATQEGYKIAAGDTVEVSVVGIRDLNAKSIVSREGYVLSPVGGQFKVMDLTVKEARDRAREEITTKLFRQRSPDGKESVIQITPDEIQFSIISYRPIYISGDVSKPGEQIFRPGMTVRQAVSMAGGYEGETRGGIIVKKTEAQSDYNVAVVERSQMLARGVRLEAELQGTVWPSQIMISKTLDIDAVDAKFIEGERQQFLARQADFAKEKENLSQALIDADKRLLVLRDQQKVENEGSKADLEDFNRVKDIAERGAATNLRVTDARRASLLSASRALQTTATVAQLEKEREELRGKLSRLDGERRVLILKELQENKASVATLNSKIAGLMQKMKVLGLGSTTSRDIDVFIYRKVGVVNQNISSTMDSDVLPGDVIEVIRKNGGNSTIEAVLK